FVAAGRGRHGAADDTAVARRAREEPLVVRSRDEIERVAGVGQVEERRGARRIGVATGHGEREMDLPDAVRQAAMRVDEKRAFIRIRTDRDGGGLVDLDECATGVTQRLYPAVERFGRGAGGRR